jgi:hypothetical protein
MKIVVRVEPIPDWGEVHSAEIGRIDRPSQKPIPENIARFLEEHQRVAARIPPAFEHSQDGVSLSPSRSEHSCGSWPLSGTPAVKRSEVAPVVRVKSPQAACGDPLRSASR